MDNNITIGGNSLAPKEFNGQRVITFKDIDLVHQRPEGTAGRNFRQNKKHFVEGEDFYKVCADEIRRNKIMDTDIRMSVFKLLHKLPNTIYARKPEGSEKP